MAKILIVEDDLAFGTMIQTWLRKKGFEVEKATSVGMALHLLEEDSERDLILSDLRLPDHDGLTLLQWLRKHDISIPFIVMTSYAEVQNAVLAMKSGATDYISKPFPPDMLLEKIHDALKVKKEERRGKNSDASTKEVGNSPASSDECSQTSLPKYIEGESEASK